MESARRRIEDALSIEEGDQHNYRYNSADEGEPEEEASSFILNDCADQHCCDVPEYSSPGPPHVCPQSRPSPPFPQPAAAIRHHHNYCRTSRAQTADRHSEVTNSDYTWDIALLRALRKDPISNKREGVKRKQPGRIDMSFIPKKGDVIIHHDSKQWRRVLEFYDPTFQRLHDGDILIRIRIDSYSCLGIILMKATSYMYHRGYWMFLGTDSDQISQYLQGW